MARQCQTCNHSERDRIEQALANTRSRIAGGVEQVSRKWCIPRSSLRRHMDNHMTQEQFARLRFGVPDGVDASIEEIIRQEGEGAILGLRRLKEEHRAAVDRWEQRGEFEQARKERIEVRKVQEALAEYAGMIPGRKQVTNNNLVLADFNVFAEQLDKVLRPFPEARKAVAAMFLQPALEGPR